MPKKWQMVSASQISTYDADRDPRTGCARRWYMEKIASIPAPKTAAQNRGSDLHLQVENYYLRGAEVTSPILQKGLPYWPARTPTVQIERWFSLDVDGWPDDREQKLLSFSDVKDMPWGMGRFVGKPDLLDPGVPVPLVVDFKNFASFQYVSKPDDMIKAPALISYARAALMARPDSDQAMVKYIVHKTATPHKAIEVPALFSREAVNEGWNGLLVTIGKMRDTAKIETWEDVTPNWGACKAYGGCAYRDRCEAARTRGKIVDIWAQAMAPFESSDGLPTVVQIAALVHLWLTSETVPERATEILSTMLREITDSLWERTILPYDDAQPRVLAVPETEVVNVFRELVRWQNTAKIDLGQDRAERYQAVIAFLTARKTPCENDQCMADKFCHCHFQTKRKEPIMNMTATETKPEIEIKTAAPALAQAGFMLVYGAVYKSEGAVVVLSAVLAGIKNQIAGENGVAHYLQVPFAKLRGDVIARGLLKVQNVQGVLVIDPKCEVECEIARMLMDRAVLVVGVRS